MKRSASAAVFVVVLLAVSVSSADEPRVLGTGRGAIGRFVSLEPPVKLVTVPAVPAALRASVASGVPKSLIKGQPFSLGPTTLKAQAQGGMRPSLMILHAELVSHAAVFFGGGSSSVFAVGNVPPGAWFVDCTLGEVDSDPFSVLFGDGAANPNADTVTPQGGHLVLGLLVKTRAQLHLSRAKSWAITGCAFEPL